MNKRTIGIIMLIASFLAGLVINYRIKFPSIQVDNTVSWQAYKNEEYGFGFKYPDNEGFRIEETRNSVIIRSNEGEGPWVYGVHIQPNGNGIPLDEAVRNVITTSINGAEPAWKTKVTISDTSLDGRPAKKFLLGSFGDNGNIGVVLLIDNNIISITGTIDLQSKEQSDFDLFLSTFKFK